MKFCQHKYKGRPHTCEQSQSTTTNMEDAIIIFRGIYVPDGHLLLMRNLVESMLSRLEDVLSREDTASQRSNIPITPFQCQTGINKRFLT